jgi:hypothetical protein
LIIYSYDQKGNGSSIEKHPYKNELPTLFPKTSLGRVRDRGEFRVNRLEIDDRGRTSKRNEKLRHSSSWHIRAKRNDDLVINLGDQKQAPPSRQVEKEPKEGAAKDCHH